MSPRKAAAIVSIPVETTPSRPIIPEDYLSFTIDTSLLLGGHWWGPKKRIAHGVAGERTEALDLKNERLRAYARALAPAMLRIGGTEADRLRYGMGKKAAASFGFEPAEEDGEERTGVSHEFVLRKGLWRDLHRFLAYSRFTLLFTLSAGPADRDGEGNWKEDNARKLIAYSRLRGFPVAAWELGNEVNAFPFIHGLRRRVSGKRYAEDFERFGLLARKLAPEAVLLGPASAIWPRIGEPNPLIRSLCASRAAAFLDAVSWHYYPQQSSFGRIATRRAAEGNMLKANLLDEALRLNDRVRASIARTAARRRGKASENWVTETAHALYGGESGLSDTFVSTLWWLDELALFAREGVTKVFRQALVGARYGLLDQESMDPRPDYYASFLWKKLMGNVVLSERPSVEKTGKLRLYLHGRAGTFDRTVLAINLNRRRIGRFRIEVPADPGAAENEAPTAARYLLRGDGAFTSRTMLLNGIRVTDDLVFDWGRKPVRSKYRLSPAAIPRAEDGKFFEDIDLPPLSALFMTVSGVGGDRKTRTGGRRGNR